MKTRTPLFLLPLLITVVSISSAETPNLSEKEIRHQLIMGSTEDFFPYLSKEFFKSGNREKLILVVSSVLKENSVRTTLQSSGKTALEGDEPFQYWSVFRALTLVGYLEIPDAEELIRPYTEFSDIHLRENALDALAADGSEEAIEELWRAYKIYEQKMPARLAEESKSPDLQWAYSAHRALVALATIGGASAEDKLHQGLDLLKKHAANENDLRHFSDRAILGDTKSKAERLKKNKKIIADLAKTGRE